MYTAADRRLLYVLTALRKPVLGQRFKIQFSRAGAEYSIGGFILAITWIHNYIVDI